MSLSSARSQWGVNKFGIVTATPRGVYTGGVYIYIWYVWRQPCMYNNISLSIKRQVRLLDARLSERDTARNCKREYDTGAGRGGALDRKSLQEVC